MTKIAAPILIFQDEHIYVANKPSGIHTTEQSDSTLSLSALLISNFPELAVINQQVGEAGLVQRLDYYTSGCVLGAKNSSTWSVLKSLIKGGQLNKTYLTLVEQTPRVIEINSKIGSPYRRAKKVRVYDSTCNAKRTLPAKTQIQILKTLGNGCCWLRCTSNTGRRHQIRAQLAHIGCPLVGDSLYGSTMNVTEVMPELNNISAEFLLHGESITFIHPTNRKELRIVAAYDLFDTKK